MTKHLDSDLRSHFIFRPIDKLELQKAGNIISTTHDPFHLIANLLIGGKVLGKIG